MSQKSEWLTCEVLCVGGIKLEDREAMTVAEIDRHSRQRGGYLRQSASRQSDGLVVQQRLSYHDEAKETFVEA